MRITARSTVVALLLALSLFPQRARAQSKLESYFSWGFGWSTYATYGGGNYDSTAAGPNAQTFNFSHYPIGGSSQQGTASGKPSYGYLTAASQSYANAQYSDIWYSAAMRMET